MSLPCLNFSKRNDSMVERIYIVLIAVAIGVIFLLFSMFSSKGAPKTTTKTTTTVSSSPSGLTTVTTVTTIPAVVQFYNVNVQWVYSGPKNKSGQQCYYTSHTYIDGQYATINGSAVFHLRFQPSSSQCAMTISSIEANTPGFSVADTIPGLPFSLPPGSTAQLQVNMLSPDSNFYGPLTITINYN